MDRREEIAVAKKGNRQALVSLIMERKDDYYRLAYVLTGNPHDAADAMEDMIVILFEKLHQLRNPDAFYSWSRTILGNCCRKIQRNRTRVVPMDRVPESEGEDESGLALEEKMVLESSLRNLDERYREVIRLRYYLDYDYQTIAEILQIPLGTVKSRLANGLEKIKVMLGGE